MRKMLRSPRLHSAIVLAAVASCPGWPFPSSSVPLLASAQGVTCTCPTDGSTYTDNTASECTPALDQVRCPPYLDGCPQNEPESGSVCHGLEEQVCSYGSECCYPDATSGECSCGESRVYPCWAEDGVYKFQMFFSEFCGMSPLNGGKYCGSTCDGCDPPCPKERESGNVEVAYNEPQDCRNCRKFKAGRHSETCDGWHLVYVLGSRANVTAVACPASFTLSMTGPDQSAFSDPERSFFGKLASDVSGSSHSDNPGSLDYLAVKVSQWLQNWPADDFPVSFAYPCTGCGTWFDPTVLPVEQCLLPEDAPVPPTPKPLVGKMAERMPAAPPG